MAPLRRGGGLGRCFSYRWWLGGLGGVGASAGLSVWGHLVLFFPPLSGALFSSVNARPCGLGGGVFPAVRWGPRPPLSPRGGGLVGALSDACLPQGTGYRGPGIVVRAVVVCPTIPARSVYVPELLWPLARPRALQFWREFRCMEGGGFSSHFTFIMLYWIGFRVVELQGRRR